MSSVRFAPLHLRRWLLVVLALVLPLKGAVAAIVPIVGAPAVVVLADPGPGATNALHAAIEADGAQVAQGSGDATAGSGDATAGSGYAPCHGHAADAAPDDSAPCCDSLHDHACPHLAMASLVTAIQAPALPAAAPLRASAPAAHDASVALEVPSPPPNAVD